MPAAYLRQLTAPDRTPSANRHLGMLLAFIAGAVNAGGFLAVGRYTSHMTGLLSSVADEIALGHLALAMASAIAVLTFVVGAATTAMLTHWSRRRGLESQFAVPLLLEAACLLMFGVLGANLHLAIDLVVPATVLLLCFLMGLQNAVITKISRAQIRTTHMTGILTDLGLELGRLFYWNRHRLDDPGLHVRADRERLGIHATLLAAFTVGALLGALAFKHLGFSASLPLAAVLAAVALPPLWNDADKLHPRRR